MKYKNINEKKKIKTENEKKKKKKQNNNKKTKQKKQNRSFCYCCKTHILQMQHLNLITLTLYKGITEVKPKLNQS